MPAQVLDHMLLVLFGNSEQSSEIREFFRLAKAFELGVGAWLVPMAGTPDVLLTKILEYVPSVNESVVVMSVARHVPQASIHNYQALVDWFQSAREPGQ